MPSALAFNPSLKSAPSQEAGLLKASLYPVLLELEAGFWLRKIENMLQEQEIRNEVG